MTRSKHNNPTQSSLSYHKEATSERQINQTKEQTNKILEPIKVIRTTNKKCYNSNICQKKIFGLVLFLSFFVSGTTLDCATFPNATDNMDGTCGCATNKALNGNDLFWWNNVDGCQIVCRNIIAARTAGPTMNKTACYCI